MTFINEIIVQVISDNILDVLLKQRRSFCEGHVRCWPGLQLNEQDWSWPFGIQPKCVLSASLTLYYFQFLTIVSNIAINVLAQTTLWGSIIIPLAEF